MRIFVTGASGWIGSASVAELLGAGHSVLGLARSDDAARKVEALGADVLRGNLDDLDVLRAGADASEAVVHLGYNHDFSDMPGAARTDRAAIDAFGDTLAGTGRALLIASGTLGLATGRPGTERDVPSDAAHPRVANAAATLALAERGVRSMVVRFAPTVHGAGDYGFVAVLAAIARDKGVSAYLADGTNRWSAVHVLDAATLVRLAIESAPSGAVLHSSAEEGIATRDIAAALGRGLDLPVESVAIDRADEHFGWMGRFFGADAAASSELTQELLGWRPTHAGLLADIEAGCYS